MLSYSDLLQYNPWWKNKHNIQNDPDIQKWESSTLRWNPRLKATFQWQDAIYSLRGPRQVGKTTLIKLIIRDLLLGKNASKWNVMYYQFDIENNPKDVVDTISEYLKKTENTRKEERTFVFLDEISSVKDWQKGIKKLKDMGKLNNCTLVATGSHSIDLKNASERLPGRRGKNGDLPLDKIMPPMKFAEFAYATNTELQHMIAHHNLISSQRRDFIINQLLRKEIPEAMTELSTVHNELEDCLSNYLITGGLPTSVNEFLGSNMISQTTYNTYLEAMIGDLKAAGKDETYLTQLMPNIIERIGTPVSWQGLKDNTDISSHHTVEQYVKTLSQMFVLLFLYRYDSNRNQPKYDSLKKIYFHDPLFLHSIRGWINQEDPFELSLKFVEEPTVRSRLVENVVADHAVRFAFNNSKRKSNFDIHTSVFYWQSSNNREIDFVIRYANSIVPCEVKYQNQIKKDDLHGLIDFQKTKGKQKSILLTKDKLEIRGDTVLVPTSALLLLI